MKKINKNGYAILKERVEEMESRLSTAKLELREAKLDAEYYKARAAVEESKREQLIDKYEQVINDMYEHMGFVRRLIWDFKNRKRV